MRRKAEARQHVRWSPASPGVAFGHHGDDILGHERHAALVRVPFRRRHFGIVRVHGGQRKLNKEGHQAVCKSLELGTCDTAAQEPEVWPSD